jgi:two-component system response regulator YesN
MEKRTRALFLRFFISYAAVLLVPLGFGAAGYLRMLRLLEQRTAQEQYVRFSRHTELLDQRLAELEAGATQLALSQIVRGLLDRESPFADGTVIPRILDLQRDLSSFVLTNTFVASIQVFLRRAGTVVTGYHTFFGLPCYYGRYLRYGSMSIDEWSDLVYERPHQRDYLGAQEVAVRTKQEETSTERMVLYVQTLPLGAYSIRLGAIVAFVPEREMLRHLGSTGAESRSRYLVADGQGRVIAGDARLAALAEGTHETAGKGATRLTIGGAPLLLSEVRSAHSGWRYVEAVPATVVSEGVTRETVFMVLLLGTALVVGVILSSFVASRTARPIANTLRMLVGGVEDRGVSARNQLDFLHDSVARLLESDRAFQRSLREQEPLFRMAFFKRLLAGGFATEEEARLYCSQAGLAPLPAPIRVFLARVNETRSPRDAEALARITAAKAVVRTRLSSFLQGHDYVHDADFDLIAVLVDQARWNGIHDFARGLMEMLGGQAGVSFSFGVGGPADTLLEVARSGREAQAALAYKPLSRADPVVFSDDIPSDSTLYYPLDFATKFISLTLAGEESRATELLARLREENYLRRRPSAAMQQQLEYDVRDTLTKLIDRMEEREAAAGEAMQKMLFERFDAAATVDDTWDAAAAIAVLASRAVNRAKKSHNVLLRDRIVEFLNARYADSSLYLPSVAEEFGITREYLSQFFKEQTGENFSVYLERLRIGHARELLATTDKPLAEVARRCGYNSPPVLRRAFKRVEGITPSEFRNLGERAILTQDPLS